MYDLPSGTYMHVNVYAKVVIQTVQKDVVYQNNKYMYTVIIIDKM